MRLTPGKLAVIKSEWYKKLCEELGKEPPFQQVIAKRTGIDWRNVSSSFNGHIVCRSMQEKISAEVGVHIGTLFGESAWFRVAAKKLEQRKKEIQLAAC